MKQIHRLMPNSTWLLIVMVITGMALLIFILYLAGERVHEKPISDATGVSVVSAKLAVQDHYIEKRLAFAQLEPIQLASVGFELSGTVSDIWVDEGQTVTAGQILASLDTKRLEAELTQRNATLSRRVAERQLAVKTHERVGRLTKQQLTSAQNLDDAKLAMDVAVAAEQEALAGIQRLKIEVEKSTLRAPFSGMVQSRVGQVGSVIGAGQPLLLLQRQGELRARLALSSRDAQAFQIGQTVQLQSASVTLEAMVTAILDNQRQDTRTRDILLNVTSPLTDIVAGEIVSLSIPKRIAIQGAWVPRSALFASEKGLWQLLLIEPEQNAHILKPLIVNVEYTDSEQVFIRGDLVDSMRYVSSGHHRLLPGQLVNVQSTPVSEHNAGTSYE